VFAVLRFATGVTNSEGKDENGSCYAFTMSINWKEVSKFLSGAFFVSAGVKSLFLFNARCGSFSWIYYFARIARTAEHFSFCALFALLLLWVHQEMTRPQPPSRDDGENYKKFARLIERGTVRAMFELS